MALRQFNEIRAGATYPPARERVRIQDMDKWFSRFSRQYADNTYRLKPNTFRFVANFYRDMVVSVPPAFTYEGGAREQELVQLIAPSVVNATREIVVDLVRYGAGVYTNIIPWNVGNVDPRFYFAVYKPEVNEYLGAITTLPWIENPDNSQPDRIAITEYLAGDTVPRLGI